MTIIATIVVLGVLIFVHELGHFFAARSVGIRVERFSIGLGPRVAGFTRGDTEYVISAIPLGGYVKMAGMDDEVMEAIEGGKKSGTERPAHGPGEAGENQARSVQGHDGAPKAPRRDDFDSKPVWARAWVISAGVLMNMLFALVAYSVVAAGWGNPEFDTTRVGGVQVDVLPEDARLIAEIPLGASLIRVGDREVRHWGEVQEAILNASDGTVTFSFENPEGAVSVVMEGQNSRERVALALDWWAEPVIQFVNPGTPADRAGIQAGDRIVAVDGQEMLSWTQFVEVIRASPEQEILISLDRDGGEIVRAITPSEAPYVDPVTREVRMIGQVGVQPTLPGVVYSPVGPLEAMKVGWDETVYVTGFIVGFVRDLVTGQVSARNLGSIVTIGEMSGQAAADGIPTFLRFMALFSVNLAILNLLPIPVLDGGHLVFLGIEAVRGRPLSLEQRMRWSQLGFVVLLGIMALALGNDFLRLFGL